MRDIIHVASDTDRDPTPAAPGGVPNDALDTVEGIPDGASGSLPAGQVEPVRAVDAKRGRRCPRCNGVGTVGTFGVVVAICTECAGTGWAHVAERT